MVILICFIIPKSDTLTLISLLHSAWLVTLNGTYKGYKQSYILQVRFISKWVLAQTLKIKLCFQNCFDFRIVDSEPLFPCCLSDLSSWAYWKLWVLVIYYFGFFFLESRTSVWLFSHKLPLPLDTLLVFLFVRIRTAPS